MAITQVDLPGVYGAAQRYKSNQLANQLQQMQLGEMQRAGERRNQIASLFAQHYGGHDPQTDITWNTGRQGPAAMSDKEFAGKVSAVSPEAGAQLREHMASMRAHDRAQMEYELPLMARAAQGATKDNWAERLNMLGRAGVDISDLPQEFNPKVVDSIIAMNQELGAKAPTGMRFTGDGRLEAIPGYAEAQGDIAAAKRRPIDEEIALRQAGATQVNLGSDGIDYGKPPSGYAWARSEDGKVLLQDVGGGRNSPVAVPIAGGPVATEAEAEAEAAEQRGEARVAQASVVSDDINEIFNIMEETILPVAGFGSWATVLPGTPQHDVARLLDGIKANVGFDKLQAMREASPTGGALGQVSENENRLLQSVIGSVEQSQSAPQFRRNLRRVQRTFMDTVHGADNWGLPTGEQTQAGRQIYKTPDGESFSEKSVTVTHPDINDGLPTNIPSVFGGLILPEEEAVRQIVAAGGRDPETNRMLPAFNSIKEAEAAAKARSDSLRANGSDGSVTIGSETYSREDLEFTAKEEGMTVDEVIAELRRRGGG